MYLSKEAKNLIAMEIKTRAFNSIADVLTDGEGSTYEVVCDIIDIVNDAFNEISEIKGE